MECCQLESKQIWDGQGWKGGFLCEKGFFVFQRQTWLHGSEACFIEISTESKCLEKLLQHGSSSRD